MNCRQLRSASLGLNLRSFTWEAKGEATATVAYFAWCYYGQFGNAFKGTTRFGGVTTKFKNRIPVPFTYVLNYKLKRQRNVESVHVIFDIDIAINRTNARRLSHGIVTGAKPFWPTKKLRHLTDSPHNCLHPAGASGPLRLWKLNII